MRGIAEEYLTIVDPYLPSRMVPSKKERPSRYDGKIFRSNFRGEESGGPHLIYKSRIVLSITDFRVQYFNGGWRRGRGIFDT
ncbi:hypothetical protein CEXT_157261 [Caerostris extrusa]|uniref:Uncharacterized protein n=1 Tax=Caerostris extrusa TaxID=172846 RepID=A0AAV4NDB5_CAEEX|nr:hypothetical protein CEXT_157261 [Caerostris extrusa]